MENGKNDSARSRVLDVTFARARARLRCSSGAASNLLCIQIFEEGLERMLMEFSFAV